MFWKSARAVPDEVTAGARGLAGPAITSGRPHLKGAKSDTRTRRARPGPRPRGPATRAPRHPRRVTVAVDNRTDDY